MLLLVQAVHHYLSRDLIAGIAYIQAHHHPIWMNVKQQTQAVEWRAPAIPLTRQTTVAVLARSVRQLAPDCVGPRLHLLLPLVLLPPRS